jgi:hypothetical protein
MCDCFLGISIQIILSLILGKLSSNINICFLSFAKSFLLIIFNLTGRKSDIKIRKNLSSIDFLLFNSAACCNIIISIVNRYVLGRIASN